MKRQVLLLFTVFLSMIPILVKAQQVIDVHSHMIPQSYLDYLADNHALLDEDFPIPSWNIDEHLKFMDDAGIACSILTLPAPQPWFGDSEGSAILNMVGHNVMVRYPQLKVVVPHCGSFLPLSIPRMQSLMPVMNGVGYLQGVDIAKKRRGSGIARKRCQTI